MTKKKKAPGKEQDAAIKRAGLNPLCWVVLEDHGTYLIVKHRINGDVKAIDK